MDHSQIKLKLFDYLDGPISREDKRIVEEHLQACTDCRNQLENWSHISRTVLQPLKAVQTDLFVQNVMRQVRAYDQKEDAVQWRHFLRWAFPILAFSVSGFVATLVYTLEPAKPSTAALLIGESSPTYSTEALESVSSDDQLMDSVMMEQ
jgi:anti-sigma factor RsiW